MGVELELPSGPLMPGFCDPVGRDSFAVLGQQGSTPDSLVGTEPDSFSSVDPGGDGAPRVPGCVVTAHLTGRSLQLHRHKDSV